VQQHGRGHRFVGVEDDVVEAVTLQPDGLLAPVFGDLALRVRVVGREDQAFRRANCIVNWPLMRSRETSEKM